MNKSTNLNVTASLAVLPASELQRMIDETVRAAISDHTLPGRLLDDRLPGALVVGTSEAAARLGTHSAAIRALVRSGDLDLAVTTSKQVMRITVESIERYAKRLASVKQTDRKEHPQPWLNLPYPKPNQRTGNQQTLDSLLSAAPILGQRTRPSLALPVPYDTPVKPVAASRTAPKPNHYRPLTLLFQTVTAHQPQTAPPLKPEARPRTPDTEFKIRTKQIMVEGVERVRCVGQLG